MRLGRADRQLVVDEAEAALRGVNTVKTWNSGLPGRNGLGVGGTLTCGIGIGRAQRQIVGRL